MQMAQRKKDKRCLQHCVHYATLSQSLLILYLTLSVLSTIGLIHRRFMFCSSDRDLARPRMLGGFWGWAHGTISKPPKATGSVCLTGPFIREQPGSGSQIRDSAESQDINAARKWVHSETAMCRVDLSGTYADSAASL